MSQARVADYLAHMPKAAREAMGFVEGQDKAAFLTDRRTQQAVVMSLLVIGEAAARVIDTDPDFAQAHPEIPWRSMRGMRNRMAHGYFETDYAIVWDTVRGEIPALVAALPTLVGDFES
jgi:uncharacterized protein with HEPN domain